MWRHEPFIALIMYRRVIDAFGWEPFRALFREYRVTARWFRGPRPVSQFYARRMILLRPMGAVRPRVGTASDTARGASRPTRTCVAARPV
jgi:hypothetical protein